MRTTENDFVSSPKADPSIKYTLGTKVLTDDVNLYLVFYGNWTTKQMTTFKSFANAIGKTPWYGLTKLYYSQENNSTDKTFVNGQVRVAKSVTDSGSVGSTIQGSAIRDIIQTNVDAGKFPEDPNGIYFMLTAPEIAEQIRPDLGTAAFCTDYCGYHISDVLKSGTRIQYAFAGMPNVDCLDGCAPRVNTKLSPNNDPSLDAAINAFAHELTEAVTDPVSDIDAQRAWQDSTGSENADKCAEDYGDLNQLSSGASYNMKIGRKKYLIQNNWDPTTQKCAMLPSA